MARGSGAGGEKPSGGKTGSLRLAELIRAQRRQLGMTRQELADATGIPYPTVAQIETAYRGVSPSRLGVIARVLGLDPKELYDILAAETVEPPADRPSKVTARSDDPRAGTWYVNPGYATPGRPSPRLTPPAPRAAAIAAPMGGSVSPVARPTNAARRPEAVEAAGVADPTDPADPADPTGDRQPDTVIANVLALLSSLPTDERLDALSRVQRQLLADLVEERVRHRREIE